MAHVSQKLAEIRSRLEETAEQERRLVQGLSATLNQVDDTLIGDIRFIMAQHEARRAVIMTELSLLASRLCTLPREPIDGYGEAELLAAAAQTGSDGLPHAPGNWRLAAQNIDDDLDFVCEPTPPSH